MWAQIIGYVYTDARRNAMARSAQFWLRFDDSYTEGYYRRGTYTRSHTLHTSASLWCICFYTSHTSSVPRQHFLHFSQHLFSSRSYTSYTSLAPTLRTLHQHLTNFAYFSAPHHWSLFHFVHFSTPPALALTLLHT